MKMLAGLDEWVEHPLARAAVLFAIVLFMLAVAIQLLRRLRGRADDAGITSNDLMTNFRDMHARGGLSDEEYRHIKSRLANEMHAELNDRNNEE